MKKFILIVLIANGIQFIDVMVLPELIRADNVKVGVRPDPTIADVSSVRAVFGPVEENTPDGLVKRYYPNGNLMEVFKVKDNKIHGLAKAFEKDGKTVAMTMNYEYGKLNGETINYSNGTILERFIYLSSQHHILI